MNNVVKTASAAAVLAVLGQGTAVATCNLWTVEARQQVRVLPCDSATGPDTLVVGQEGLHTLTKTQGFRVTVKSDSTVQQVITRDWSGSSYFNLRIPEDLPGAKQQTVTVQLLAGGVVQSETVWDFTGTKAHLNPMSVR